MAYRIHLETLDIDFICQANQNVLECLISSGKKGIQVGCRGGGCGVCRVEVVDGEYCARPMSKAHIDDQSIGNRQVLACCIKPKSDLSLKVLGKIASSIKRKYQL
ncbi:MAG: 2Fe-2S iron-sulfur cluster-binding protein [Gammaproteobacteria bacterium]|nr:2Fe-2S iron-sulfur cluster-binding protein [Gammaproteobacteria bacterium]